MFIQPTSKLNISEEKGIGDGKDGVGNRTDWSSAAIDMSVTDGMRVKLDRTLKQWIN